MHTVRRWLTALWYVSIGQIEHVRLAVFESAEIISPAPHIGCAKHDVERCLLALWYVSLGQPEHVRLAVRESADIACPVPHCGCASHRVLECSDELARYVSLGQLTHDFIDASR